jgi:hypothetical protein
MGDGGGNGMPLTKSLDLHTLWDHIPDEVFESDPSNTRTKNDRRQERLERSGDAMHQGIHRGLK